MDWSSSARRTVGIGQGVPKEACRIGPRGSTAEALGSNSLHPRVVPKAILSTSLARLVDDDKT